VRRSSRGPAYEPIKQAMLSKSALGKVCVAQDVADAIVSLVTGSILVTGTVLPVEGGMLLG
jgi:predicted ATP-dependent protease